MKNFIKYSICFLVFIFSALESKAQYDFSVSGIVIDEYKEPMPKLGVKVLNAKDSSLVKGTTSSDKGRFRVTSLPMGE